MTPEYVEKKVARISEMQSDPEAAHSAEDDLYRVVLHAIANGTAENPSKCAEIALTSGDFGFPRWCA